MTGVWAGCLGGLKTSAVFGEGADWTHPHFDTRWYFYWSARNVLEYTTVVGKSRIVTLEFNAM